MMNGATVAFFDCRWSPGLGIQGKMGRWERASLASHQPEPGPLGFCLGGLAGDEAPHCSPEDQT